MRDDIHRHRPPWFHEECDPDCRSIRTRRALFGRAKHQEKQIVEAASCGLSLPGDSLWRFDVPVVKGGSDCGMDLEPDSPGGVGGIDQHPVSDGLCPGVAVNKIPFIIGGHLIVPVLEWLEGH